MITRRVQSDSHASMRKRESIYSTGRYNTRESKDSRMRKVVFQLKRKEKGQFDRSS
jgi:hypothetical protein